MKFKMCSYQNFTQNINNTYLKDIQNESHEDIIEYINSLIDSLVSSIVNNQNLSKFLKSVDQVKDENLVLPSIFKCDFDPGVLMLPQKFENPSNYSHPWKLYATNDIDYDCFFVLNSCVSTVSNIDNNYNMCACMHNANVFNGFDQHISDNKKKEYHSQLHEKFCDFNDERQNLNDFHLINRNKINCIIEQQKLGIQTKYNNQSDTLNFGTCLNFLSNGRKKIVSSVYVDNLKDKFSQYENSDAIMSHLKVQEVCSSNIIRKKYLRDTTCANSENSFFKFSEKMIKNDQSITDKVSCSSDFKLVITKQDKLVETIKNYYPNEIKEILCMENEEFKNSLLLKSGAETSLTNNAKVNLSSSIARTNIESSYNEINSEREANKMEGKRLIHDTSLVRKDEKSVWLLPLEKTNGDRCVNETYEEMVTSLILPKKRGRKSIKEKIEEMQKNMMDDKFVKDAHTRTSSRLQALYKKQEEMKKCQNLRNLQEMKEKQIKKEKQKFKKLKRKKIHLRRKTRTSFVAINEKRRKKQKKKDNPWLNSSENSSGELQDDDDDFDDLHLQDQDNETIFQSDHEFSPESDLDNGEIHPIRHARTAKRIETVKMLGTTGETIEKEVKIEEIKNDKACQKCNQHDHPEWILLCDQCDHGWHASCLRPPLMVIPEGNWFCPPCEHNLLLQKLKEEHVKYKQSFKKREKDELMKRRLEYVNISLSNVLASSKDIIQKSDEEEILSSHSETEYSKDSSDCLTSYPLRQRRAAQNISYGMKEYDDLINAALKEELGVNTYEVNTCNIASFNEVCQELKNDMDSNTLKKTKMLKCQLANKKRRKLTSLEEESEDSNDEDFEQTSDDEGDDYALYEETDKSDSDFSCFSHSKKLRLRRSNRNKRIMDFDSFSEDDSDWNNKRNFVKKFRRIESNSEESDDIMPEKRNLRCFEHQKSKKLHKKNLSRHAWNKSKHEVKKKEKLQMLRELAELEPIDQPRCLRRGRIKEINYSENIESDNTDSSNLPGRSFLKSAISDEDYDIHNSDAEVNNEFDQNCFSSIFQNDKKLNCDLNILPQEDNKYEGEDIFVSDKSRSPLPQMNNSECQNELLQIKNESDKMPQNFILNPQTCSVINKNVSPSAECRSPECTSSVSGDMDKFSKRVTENVVAHKTLCNSLPSLSDSLPSKQLKSSVIGPSVSLPSKSSFELKNESSPFVSTHIYNNIKNPIPSPYFPLSFSSNSRYLMPQTILNSSPPPPAHSQLPFATDGRFPIPSYTPHGISFIQPSHSFGYQSKPQELNEIGYLNKSDRISLSEHEGEFGGLVSYFSSQAEEVD